MHSDADGDHGERIATLETLMRGLVGNGQPGTIAEIIKRLDRWEKRLLYGIILILASSLVTGSGTISLAKGIELMFGK